MKEISAITTTVGGTFDVGESSIAVITEVKAIYKTGVEMEAMERVVNRGIPGIPDAVRVFGQERNPLAMLSRARAGIRRSTAIVSLPGSHRSVEGSPDAILPGVLHRFRMMRGEGH